MEVTISSAWIVSLSVSMATASFVGMILFYFWHARRANRFSPFAEETLRLPGHSLRLERSKAMDRLTLNYFQYLLAVTGLTLSILFLSKPVNFIATAMAAVYIAYLIVTNWKAIGRIRTLGLGLEGEVYTGQELNLLMREGAYVFHDIPYRYGNIDHIVVGHDKAFAVETKAIRKSQSRQTGKRQYVATFDGETLIVSGKSGADYVNQANRHAEYLRKALQDQCGVAFPVVPVVALPGWFVRSVATDGGAMVINPKRGAFLKDHLGKLSDSKARDHVAAYIESVARSVAPDSDKSDPDASTSYDFWLNPRVKERSL